MAQSVMERKGPNGKLRVAVYCRVSGDGDGSLNTLEVQRDHYTQEIQAHPEWKLAGIFADESLTGNASRRSSPSKPRASMWSSKGKTSIPPQTPRRFRLPCMTILPYRKASASL